MNNYKITSLARLAQIGLVYIYLSKLIDTLYHGIFKPVTFAGVIVLLNILAGFAQLLFFLALYKFFVTKNDVKLHHAGMIAVVGSTIALLPKFLALSVLLQHESLFFFFRLGNQISVFCPWFSSSLMIVFCSIGLFHKNIEMKGLFKRALTVGLIGWSVMFAAHSMVLINYIQKGKLIWLVNLLNSGLILFVIMSTTTFICLVFFYQAFTKTDLYDSNRTIISNA